MANEYCYRTRVPMLRDYGPAWAKCIERDDFRVALLGPLAKVPGLDVFLAPTSDGRMLDVLLSTTAERVGEVQAAVSAATSLTLRPVPDGVAAPIEPSKLPRALDRYFGGSVLSWEGREWALELWFGVHEATSAQVTAACDALRDALACFRHSEGPHQQTVTWEPALRLWRAVLWTMAKHEPGDRDTEALRACHHQWQLYPLQLDEMFDPYGRTMIRYGDLEPTAWLAEQMRQAMARRAALVEVS